MKSVKILPVLLALILSLPLLSAEFRKVNDGGTGGPDPVKRKADYDIAAAKWKSAGVDNYVMTVRYSAFSPLSGVWEVEVTRGNVVHWKFGEKADDPKLRGFAKSLTMDRFFNMARESYNADTDRPFLTEAEYSDDDGHVTEVARVRNSGYKGKAPTDKTYRYSVIEIKIRSMDKE